MNRFRVRELPCRQLTHPTQSRTQTDKHASKVAQDSEKFLSPAQPGLEPARGGQVTSLRCARRDTTSKGREVVLCARGKAPACAEASAGRNPKFQETSSNKFKQVPNTRKSSKLQRPKPNVQGLVVRFFRAGICGLRFVWSL